MALRPTPPVADASNPSDADLVRALIFGVIDQTPRSVLAAQLTAAGLRTARGKNFSDKAVTRAVERLRETSAVDGIVDPEIHAHFVAALDLLPPSTKPPAYLLTGKLKCAAGHQMYAPSPRSKKYACKPCGVSVAQADAEACWLEALGRVWPQILAETGRSDAIQPDPTAPASPETLPRDRIQRLTEILLQDMIYDPARREFRCRTFLCA